MHRHRARQRAVDDELAGGDRRRACRRHGCVQRPSAAALFDQGAGTEAGDAADGRRIELATRAVEGERRGSVGADEQIAGDAGAGEQRDRVGAGAVQQHMAYEGAGIAERGVSGDDLHRRGALNGRAGPIDHRAPIDQAHAGAGAFDEAARAGVGHCTQPATNAHAGGNRVGSIGNDRACGVGHRATIREANAVEFARDGATALVGDGAQPGDDFHAMALIVRSHADRTASVGHRAGSPYPHAA